MFTSMPFSVETKLRQIDFRYTETNTLRLFLDFVHDSQGNFGYEFYYNNRSQLPEYLSNKLDHWGFYNNINAGVLPSDYNAYYNMRDSVDFQYLSLGILNKIKYPTGGYTELVYEPHEYRK